MQVVRAALLVLGAAKIRQHVVEAPARIAELAPMVEVLGLPADIQKPVDRRGPAEYLAARLDDRAAGAFGLRLGAVEPVVLGIGEQLGVADRHVDPDVAILAAGFQHQHAMAARCAEPVSEHAAGRAGAHDDVVERTRFLHDASS